MFCLRWLLENNDAIAYVKENPERYVTAFVQAGANSVSVHYEAARHLDGGSATASRRTPRTGSARRSWSQRSSAEPRRAPAVTVRDAPRRGRNTSPPLVAPDSVTS